MFSLKAGKRNRAGEEEMDGLKSPSPAFAALKPPSNAEGDS